MSKGLSLHIGINECDPEHYGGWSGPLKGCESDCDAMSKIALAKGFDPVVLKTKDATRQNVIDTIADIAAKCDAGDAFLLTYSGHGNTHKDHFGDEADGRDETWVLHDDELFDDEIRGLLTKFAPGVRITLVSDSCHSGSVSKSGPPGLDGGPPGEGVFLDPVGADDLVRAMPRDVSENVAVKWADHLRGIRNSELARIKDPVKAHVVAISGCRDDQRSYEREGRGLFSRALEKVWGDGQFRGNYQQLRDQIVAEVGALPNSTQEPQITTDGDRSFDMRGEEPFKI
jgi:hypothetical protein